MWVIKSLVGSGIMLDSLSWKCLNFQVPVTPVMEGIVELSSLISLYLIIILSVVTWMLITSVWSFYYARYYPKNVTELHCFGSKVMREGRFWEDAVVLEGVWTVLPSAILLTIAVPSLSLLYSMEELINPALTIKITGHQWYWSYEYVAEVYHGSDVYKLQYKFDSYLVDANDLKDDELRLLTVDNPLFIPLRVHTRLLITSDDVIHSWAVPSLGVKVDAVPGRINQTMVFIQKAGTYYGQCSEICGSGHGFMPIMVEALDWGMFDAYFEHKLR